MHMLPLTIILIAIFAIRCIPGQTLSGPGQTLSIGVVGGGSVTDAFPNDVVQPVGAYSPSKDYIVGPMVEWRFSPRWAIEADGLYRKLHLTVGSGPSPVVTWEFPVLAKYRFEWPGMKPFVELGPSFRTAGNLNGTNPSHPGVTAGFGVELHAYGLNFAPAVRYTRWESDHSLFFGPITSPDQVELLLGVSSASKVASHPLGRHLSVGAVAGVALTDRVRLNRSVSDPSRARS